MAARIAQDRCANPWQQMIIDLTGEVVPCCYWSGYGNTGKPLGNTNTSSLADIWNGEGYRALRSKLATGELTDHPCGNCMAYRWAGNTFPKFTWPASFAHEEGHCYFGRIPESFLAATQDCGAVIELTEDGVALPIADAPHADIRSLGGGRYSVWHGWLYFSASDNSNPIESGRRYELVAGDHVAALTTLVAESKSGHNIKLAHEEFASGAGRLRANPTMVSYISTADCNIDCPACSQNVVRYAKIQHRPSTTAEVLELVPHLASFVWHGGEPYLIKRFRDFIDHFLPEHNPNLVFGFTSNGQQITAEEVEKLLKFPRINASISIDSFAAPTFARIRTGGNFARIIDNLHRLMKLYDAPQRVFSVGMIICKSNIVELPENLAYAFEHDIAINLSPVLVYPVTEQLNVFADFPTQTVEWDAALVRAAALVEQAKVSQRRSVQRIDPAGMMVELRSIYERAKVEHADVVELPCEVDDPHGSIARMRAPGIIAYSSGTPIAYADLRQGAGHYVLKLPRRLAQNTALRVEVVHSMLEPQGVLMSQTARHGVFKFAVRIWMPKFEGAPRPRNIMLANFGDVTPDGAHVRDANEVSAAYARLHRHELRNEGARMVFIQP